MVDVLPRYRQKTAVTVSWKMDRARTRRHILVGGAGILLGGAFLWLALRNVNPVDIGTALRKAKPEWLITAVTVYLASIALRCLRWGILLRATGSVKWRHAAEVLVTGYAVNFVLPGRIGELFRADYSCRIFNMSRFASLGTIVVERVCDGIVLVVALWISLAWISLTRIAFVPISWILLIGAASTALFGVALILVLVAQLIDLRRFGIMEAIAARWDKLVKGTSSVLRTNMTTIVLCSLGVLALDALTVTCIVRSFGIGLSAAETLLLLSIASLSTLVPTAPGYLGTYQLVFGQVLQFLGYPETIGVVAATAVQICCFGAVVIIGGVLVMARGSLTIWHVHKRVPQGGS